MSVCMNGAKQEFLEEELVEEYVPHPLDVSTLFDFLKLFEEEDDQYGTRKMSALLGGATAAEGELCGAAIRCATGGVHTSISLINFVSVL